MDGSESAMVGRETARWYRYWQQKSDAEHRFSARDWFVWNTKELMLMFPEGRLRTLELGCGCGDLHEFMRDCFATYVGVDFSGPLLSQFHKRWPDTPLVCADAATYRDRQRYDLIFSNQLVQYLDRAMIRQCLRNAYDMLPHGGICVLGGIPDAALRLHHYLHLLEYEGVAPSILARIRSLAAVGRTLVFAKPDGIGNWYSRKAIADLARETAFDCTFFSSMCYGYRFHARLEKK